MRAQVGWSLLSSVMIFIGMPLNINKKHDIKILFSLYDLDKSILKRAPGGSNIFREGSVLFFK